MTSPAVAEVMERLRAEFADATVTFFPDGSGGGNVIVEPVELGPRYRPSRSWLGAHLSNALPYADVYPLFVGAEVAKTDGTAHQTPVTSGHQFAGRAALQISKRANNLTASAEAAALKFVKVLHYFRELAP